LYKNNYLEQKSKNNPEKATQNHPRIEKRIVLTTDSKTRRKTGYFLKKNEEVSLRKKSFLNRKTFVKKNYLEQKSKKKLEKATQNRPRIEKRIILTSDSETRRKTGYF